MNKACGRSNTAQRHWDRCEKKIQTSSGRDVSALCGGSSNSGAWTVPPGCTEKKLTGAESDTNVKQTLVNVFV